MQSRYYLVRFDSLSPQKDYESVLTNLKTYTGMAISQTGENECTIQVEGAPHSFRFCLVLEPVSMLKSSGTTFLVECEPGDMGAMNLMRHAAAQYGYRMFSVESGNFIPQDLSLFPVNLGLLTEEAAKVFRLYGLEPIFGYGDKIRYYAKDAGGRIQIVNPALLEYYITYGITGADSREFAYVVADNLNEFVALYDAGLVPEHFYDYYGRNMTFINYSGMDIWQVKRKVFIKPYVFTYQPERVNFELLTKDKSVMNFADKIRPGENLKTAIERILREELKITVSYLKVRISRNLEFDRDRNDVLTPRLNVGIFFRQLELKGEAAQQARRSWTSLEGMVN